MRSELADLAPLGRSENADLAAVEKFGSGPDEENANPTAVNNKDQVPIATTDLAAASDQLGDAG